VAVLDALLAHHSQSAITALHVIWGRVVRRELGRCKKTAAVVRGIALFAVALVVVACFFFVFFPFHFPCPSLPLLIPRVSSMPFSQLLAQQLGIVDLGIGAPC
jgi:hypothetical protein